MKKKYYAEYKTELVTETKTVKSEGASILEFIRQGTDNLTILGDINLNSDNPSIAFINRENVEIKQEFLVRFTGVGSQNVVVIKTIYTEDVD